MCLTVNDRFVMFLTCVQKIGADVSKARKQVKVLVKFKAQL